jgi:alpha-ketoglutarate-dependent taurine dioxygenase
LSRFPSEPDPRSLGSLYEATGELPLSLSPRADSPGSRNVTRLCQALKDRRDEVQALLLRHGAIRFRGFDVEDAGDFERIARAVDDDLKRDYLGTSPRDLVTDYVFNASELPDFYPIPQHCEMSFCAHPPRRVFFCCLVEPAEGGGETPLCDFRRVWADLDPGVRDRFEAKGIRHVRNYAAPGAEESADPTQLKPWPDMFHTTDHSVVEAKSRAEGFEPVWVDGEALRLISSQPVMRAHPTTGEPVWHNHLTTFHRSTAEAELRRVAEYRPTERQKGLARMAAGLAEKLADTPPEELGMHTTHLDGSEIDPSDVEHVRDVIWRHMSIEPWKRGDVVAIDNHSTSHGRLPYEGDRKVVVCWA